MSCDLVIDTSLQGVSMGLVRSSSSPGYKGGLLWVETHTHVGGSAQAMTGLLQSGLTSVGIQLKDVKRLVISPGPGSFTGIKIGLAFAYGLMAARPDLTCYSFSAVQAALDVILCQDGGEAGASAEGGCLFLPATRTHGFVARSDARGGRDVSLLDLTAFTASQGFAQRFGSSPILIFGAWPRLEGLISNAGLEARTLAPEVACRAAVTGMAQQAANASPQEFRRTLPDPRYLRLSTAEERLREGNSRGGGGEKA